MKPSFSCNLAGGPSEPLDSNSFAQGAVSKHYTILYYTILYYTILYYTILY